MNLSKHHFAMTIQEIFVSVYVRYQQCSQSSVKPSNPHLASEFSTGKFPFSFSVYVCASMQDKNVERILCRSIGCNIFCYGPVPSVWRITEVNNNLNLVHSSIIETMHNMENMLFSRIMLFSKTCYLEESCYSSVSMWTITKFTDKVMKNVMYLVIVTYMLTNT